jgi:hypothetical protein
VVWHNPSTDVQEPTILASKQLHQSAITAVAALKVAANQWLVVTGGDDNAVGVTLLVFDNATGPTRVQIKSFMVNNAHAAAVTGISLFYTPMHNWERLGKDTMRAITVGLDQRLRTWDIEIDSSSFRSETALTVRKGQSDWTSISDPSDLVSIPQDALDTLNSANGDTPYTRIDAGLGSDSVVEFKRHMIVVGVGLETRTIGKDIKPRTPEVTDAGAVFSYP